MKPWIDDAKQWWRGRSTIGKVGYGIATLIVVGLFAQAFDGSTPSSDEPLKTTVAAQTTTQPEHAKVSKPDKITACLEDVAYTVEHPQSDMLRVRSGGGNLTAVILTYKSAKKAQRSASEGVGDGLNIAAFGKRTVTYFNKAADPASPQARVITDCVS